ncbi:lytic polysaccharide monooxygenase auxiliary activity family 9 protein [Fodinicola feengrottensis]|uniref:lytic polysaccharide monooxygenase auxiliary activity family 9 protein n=1 Tax=Fodinicola feengrottensis TaxID=435914 RepID=UPI0013D54C58|nr:lytic polysaccharide monooxygenase auxiliary activity family 9 protein [Fodinicola feengrottensis]
MPLIVLALPVAPASAHGYVSAPPSRQAQCAAGTVSCGDIKYEPQSVEGPKGLRRCDGGVARFAELNDDTKGWHATATGRTVTFNWVLTAAHRTASWEYYIGNTRVGFVDGNNSVPPTAFSHTINLGNVSGRQKVLAIWNIADTANAFYSCIDLQVS